ncbi:MAG TPA: S8 family serine peptidase [Pyrinomonadaceae bacterium]|nr:S8 family serine peptidase [Pyrinomonadaceae bacterium]
MQGSYWEGKSTTKHLLVAFSFLLLALLIGVCLSPGSSATPQTSDSKPTQKKSPPFVPGEVLVRYRSEKIASRRNFETLANADGGLLLARLERFAGSDLVPGLRIARVDAADTLAVVSALNAQPDVLYAEPNYRWYRTTATPNDPCFPTNALPGCQSTSLYGLSKIGAPTAWDTVKGSRDSGQAGFGTPKVVVAVIDEGVDVTHQDLVDNIWTNPVDNTVNGIDEDGNGFVDDVNGYDFFANTGTIVPAAHGTHVAGTIGARGDNSTGVVGVNWQVGLMSLRFIGSGGGSTADAIRATAYAKLMRDRWVSTGGAQGANVRVLNNSWGPDRRFGNGLSPALFDAINSVGQSGILFVCSAGNDSIDNDVDPGYPASFDLPNLISVAATDQVDGLASISDFGGHTITLGAPGIGILSTTLNNTYTVFNGTSMAAPHVSGAAALLLAANQSLTMQKLKSLLIFNGDLVSSLSGKTLTGRRLNIGKSVQELALNDTTPPGTVLNFHINTQNGRSLNLGWTASGDDGASGTASLYNVTFTDATTGTIFTLKAVTPAASGVTQTVDVKLPYRHINGTLTLREYDNSGNEGTPATAPVSVSLVEGDPYITSTGSSVGLSSNGTPLVLTGDDKLKLDYTLPFTFPFFGENFTKVNISTNGNLFFSPPPTRTNGDADDVPSSLKTLVRYKMISGLWDDLRTDRRVGDDVYVVTPNPSTIIFRWSAVTFGDGTPATEFPVNFEIELRSNGTILTRYGTGQTSPTNTSLLPVVGISAGEPDTYVILSHTSKNTFLSLTNAPEVTFLPRGLSVNSSVQFQASQFNAFENTPPNAPVATLTVTRSGDTSTQASVDFSTADGSATQKGDYEVTFGRVTFNAGESTKNVQILVVDDALQEGTESFSVTLSNPIGTTLGGRSVAQVDIFDNDLSTGSNPLDDANAIFFVRQHYLDFLNREPDASGLAFWANQITSCGSDTQCLEIRRINVSAAFFLSIEFQETGYLAYKMYKAAYGNIPGAPVPVTYGEFMPDTQEISRGVVVGAPGADVLLEANKVAFSNAFVSRTRFTTAYSTTLTPAQFVDALIGHAGFTPTAAERTAFINEFGNAVNTVDTQARARVVRAIAQNGTFSNQEKNNAFVLMQYFGYMRRNPYDPPESTLDYQGYNFWLGKLNQFNGNFVNADMVKAFIVSGEYRHRFGP